MVFESQPTRRWSALILAFAVLYFGVHLWFLVAAAASLNNTDRADFFSEARDSMAYWSLFCLLGIAFAATALRFERLTTLSQRVVLVACAATGVLVGSIAEWWTSLYFVFPAVFLALSHQQAAHA
jgi:hypothetical protein